MEKLNRTLLFVCKRLEPQQVVKVQSLLENEDYWKGESTNNAHRFPNED